MRIPKRFALSTLLLLMLVVAVVFGYAQWRRLHFESEARRLNESGIYFVPYGAIWPDIEVQVTDGFWAEVEPQQIGISISIDRFGRCSLKGRGNYTTIDNAEDNLKEVFRSLKGIGITDVEFDIWGNIPDGNQHYAGPYAEVRFLRTTHSEWSRHYQTRDDLWFWEKWLE